MKSEDCEWSVWRKATDPSLEFHSDFAIADWIVIVQVVQEQEVVAYLRVVVLESGLDPDWFVAVVAASHRRCPSLP